MQDLAKVLPFFKFHFPETVLATINTVLLKSCSPGAICIIRFDCAIMLKPKKKFSNQ